MEEHYQELIRKYMEKKKKERDMQDVNKIVDRMFSDAVKQMSDSIVKKFEERTMFAPAPVEHIKLSYKVTHESVVQLQPRTQPISEDDILNLRISLETAKDVNDIMEV